MQFARSVCENKGLVAGEIPGRLLCRDRSAMLLKLGQNISGPAHGWQAIVAFHFTRALNEFTDGKIRHTTLHANGYTVAGVGLEQHETALRKRGAQPLKIRLEAGMFAERVHR